MANSSKKPLVPLWAQAVVGVSILILVVVISSQTSFYTSDWSEVNSNFYKNGMDAISHSRINIYQGPVPTLVVFWEMGCEVCVESLKFLTKVRDPLNVIGVHMSLNESQKTEARKWWLKHAPRKSPLYFDSQNMMEKTFQIRGLPASFLIYPLENKMMYNVGSLKWSKPNIKKLAREAKRKADQR
jgi:hypothetical protein